MEKRRLTKKEMWIFVIVLFMCIGAILGILCYSKTNKSFYALNLSSADSVYNIDLEQNGKIIEINEQDKIKDIVNGVAGVKRTTNYDSIQDSPINVDNEIKIDFEFGENKISTVFVYEKKDKYFIEQSYNGIYKISPDEYNSIEKYIRESN